MSWHSGRLAAFDIETTGTDTENDRIVTAAVSVVGGGEETISTNWLVDPGVEIPAEATAVHRITTERARGEGLPADQAVFEITEHLAELTAGRIPIVAFNARFDLTILDREARRYDQETLIDLIGGPEALLVVDPYVLDKQYNRFRKGRRTLSVLCEAYGIPLDDAHAADADALAAARLAWKLGNIIDELGALDLDSLHAAQITWAAEQAESLSRYFAEQGRSERIEGAWPVVPAEAAVTELAGPHSVAPAA
ncbi:MAG: exonuclease domain-containing protein [Solirubrobacterales bacterium]